VAAYVTSRTTVADAVKPPPVPDIISWYVFTGVEPVVWTTKIANSDPPAGGVTMFDGKKEDTEIEVGTLAALLRLSVTGDVKPPLEVTVTLYAADMPGEIVCVLG